METNTTPTPEQIHSTAVARGIRETNNTFRVNFWMERSYQEDQAALQDPYDAIRARRSARHYRDLARVYRGI